MAEKKTVEKKKERPGRRPTARAAGEHQILRLERKNWILFGSGLGAVALGFLLLRLGDITIAPFLLVGGYLVLIPWSLIARQGPPKARPGKEPDPSA
jgi:hypothetical protein